MRTDAREDEVVEDAFGSQRAMSGGQECLKPSRGNFFVASMPSLRPLAISLAVWSNVRSKLRELQRTKLAPQAVVNRE